MLQILNQSYRIYIGSTAELIAPKPLVNICSQLSLTASQELYNARQEAKSFDLEITLWPNVKRLGKNGLIA